MPLPTPTPTDMQDDLAARREAQAVQELNDPEDLALPVGPGEGLELPAGASFGPLHAPGMVLPQKDRPSFAHRAIRDIGDSIFSGDFVRALGFSSQRVTMALNSMFIGSDATLQDFTDVGMAQGLGPNTVFVEPPKLDPLTAAVPLTDAIIDLDHKVKEELPEFTSGIVYRGAPYIFGAFAGFAIGGGVAASYGAGAVGQAGLGVVTSWLADFALGFSIEVPSEAGTEGGDPSMFNVLSSLQQEGRLGGFGEMALTNFLMRNIIEPLSIDEDDNELTRRFKQGLQESSLSIFADFGISGAAGFIKGTRRLSRMLRTREADSLIAAKATMKKSAEDLENVLWQVDPKLIEGMDDPPTDPLQVLLQAERGGVKVAEALESARAMTDKPLGEIYEAMRKTKTGRQIIGIRTMTPEEGIKATLDRLRTFATEGQPGRDWYRDSAAAVMRLTQGSVEAADQFLQLIAIYSANREVAANFDLALKSWNGFKATGTIKEVASPDQDLKALAVMQGEPFDGRKTNNFYNNLMFEIDPTRAFAVTADMWMARASAFSGIEVRGRKFDFIEGLTKELADEMGVTPHQAQAMIWVSAKARYDLTRKAAFEEAAKRGLGSYKQVNGKRTWVHRGKTPSARQKNAQKQFEIWDDMALAADLPQEKLEKAARHYGDFAEKHNTRISTEAMPGDLGHLPELAGAADEVKTDFFAVMMSAGRDENGFDMLAAKLGILIDGNVSSPGYYNGLSELSDQTSILAPRIKNASKLKTAQIDPTSKTLLNAYAAIRGMMLKQDAVGWHRPQFGMAMQRSDGFRLDVEGGMSKEDTLALGEAIGERLEEGLPRDKIVIVTDTEGVSLMNIYGDALKNREWHDIVLDAGDAVFGDRLVKTGHFATDGGLVEGGWKNGVPENYIKEVNAAAAGSPDLLAWLRDVYYPRFRDAEAGFASAHGFTANPELTAGIERALGIKVEVETGAGGSGARVDPAPDPAPDVGQAAAGGER